MSSGTSHLVRIAAPIVGLVIVAAGCAATPPVPGPSAAATPASVAASVAPSAAIATGIPSGVPDPLPISQAALKAGPYLIAMENVAGGAGVPDAVITVPDGWSSIDGWGVNLGGEEEAEWAGITFWSVDEVYAHPCQWDVPKLDPGSTVEGLASALVKVPLREATTPADVTLDGYQGKRLDWSVPTDMDFSTCDADSEGTGFFSWTGTGAASLRYQQGPGQVDRLWILDIGGARLVIDAMSMPGTSDATIAEMVQIVESIDFEP